MTDAIARQIVAALQASAKEQRECAARLQELESQGYRITNGGQIDHTGKWEYTDWRTGEVLAKGRNSRDHDKLQMPDNWYHIDNTHEVVIEPDRIAGLPASLAETIIEWTFEHEEEARAFVETKKVVKNEQHQRHANEKRRERYAADPAYRAKRKAESAARWREQYNTDPAFREREIKRSVRRYYEQDPALHREQRKARRLSQILDDTFLDDD